MRELPSKALTEFQRIPFLICSRMDPPVRFLTILGVSPVVVGGCKRDAEGVSRLLPAQARKKSQFDQFCGTSVVLLQFVEAFAEGEQTDVWSDRGRDPAKELDALMLSACLRPMLPPRIFDQNP